MGLRRPETSDPLRFGIPSKGKLLGFARYLRDSSCPWIEPEKIRFERGTMRKTNNARIYSRTGKIAGDVRNIEEKVIAAIFRFVSSVIKTFGIAGKRNNRRKQVTRSSASSRASRRVIRYRDKGSTRISVEVGVFSDNNIINSSPIIRDLRCGGSVTSVNEWESGTRSRYRPKSPNAEPAK